MKQVNMYEYDISGFYFKNGVRQHFSETVEAPNNVVAMQMVCGQIFMKSEGSVIFGGVHYEVK